MGKLRYVFLMGLLLFSRTMMAQRVSNVTVAQEGQKLRIQYELSTTSPAEVGLYISENNGSTWSKVTHHLTGEVGPSVSAGSKQMIWDLLQARESLVGNAIVFKVKVGSEIKSVKIGNQVWMAENLNVDHYRNGDPIPTGLSNAQWESTTKGAYAIYNDDPANEKIYGKLYNWYAVSDARGLCPTGWHVPGDDEWTELEKQLGVDRIEAGRKMKSENYWKRDNSQSEINRMQGISKSNNIGFNALPGGWRGYSNKAFNPLMEFNYLNYYGFWWMSGYSTFDLGCFDVPDMPSVMTKNYGISVRCIKD